MNIINGFKDEIKETEESQKLNSDSREISLWIDSYDDIFSDFDPRPFSARNISDDFLHEIKKVSRENDFNITELKLLIPETNRNTEDENIITKRLHSYFLKNEHYLIKKKIAERKDGFLYILLGTIMMLGASFVSSSQSTNIFMHILLVIFEPAGWFFVWVGLENVIYKSPKEKPELDFYSKMSKSKIVFWNI
jgi:hypothetical protein